MGNFINICYSLALRHQLHQCYLSINSDSLLGERTEIGPGMCLQIVSYILHLIIVNRQTQVNQLNAISLSGILPHRQAQHCTGMYHCVAVVIQIMYPNNIFYAYVT